MEPETLQPRFNPQLIKLLAAVVGAIFIGLLIVAFANKGQVVEGDDTFTNSSFSREALVEVSGNGFKPAELTISRHTRVTWSSGDGQTHILELNDAGQEDGPAADPDNDPELPNGAEISSSTVVQHVFEKPSVYMFHDQKNPTANLTITVQ